jgi:hypothetical protein
MDHLVLFFDVNGTIVALDSAQEKTIEITLLQELAKTYTARWHESVAEPITYAKFVRRYLLRGEEKIDLSLKQKRQQKYANFLSYLKEHHKNIYEDVYHDFLNLRATLLKNKGHLFASFIKLLSELQIRQIPFTLVLRSFGNDIPAVRQELNDHLIEIKDVGYFKGPTLHLQSRQLQCPQEIIQSLQSGHHQAWKDDWDYWHKNHHEGLYGKPFYLSEKQPLSLFFDDKAFEKDIVHIQRIDMKEMSKEEAILNKYLFAVDTLQAIRDENYFCDRVFCKIKKEG